MNPSLTRIAHAVDTIDRAFDTLAKERDTHPHLHQAIVEFVAEGRDHLELIRALCADVNADRDARGDQDGKRAAG